jgi:hypothetical protein
MMSLAEGLIPEDSKTPETVPEKKPVDAKV